MSKYIYFTPEEKARAQNTDLVSLLRAQGERPVRSGREFRTPNDPSITVRDNKWFDHSKREGGYAVSFVQRYYRLPYQEAVLLLLGRKNGFWKAIKSGKVMFTDNVNRGWIMVYSPVP